MGGYVVDAAGYHRVYALYSYLARAALHLQPAPNRQYKRSKPREQQTGKFPKDLIRYILPEDAGLPCQHV